MRIKKVAVTPLSENTGTIIDSLNTTDNKHTNAPSIEAVNNALNNCIVKDNFAIITDSITIGSNIITINMYYPDGFTVDNCVVISCGIKLDENFIYEDTYDNSSLGYAMIKKQIELTSNKISLRFIDIDINKYTNIDYKIVLMKIN